MIGYDFFLVGGSFQFEPHRQHELHPHRFAFLFAGNPAGHQAHYPQYFVAAASADFFLNLCTRNGAVFLNNKGNDHCTLYFFVASLGRVVQIFIDELQHLFVGTGFAGFNRGFLLAS